MKPHPNPRIPPHPIYLFTYITSSTIYSTYVFEHHPYIPSLGYLYHPTPSFTPSYKSPNLHPTDLFSH